MVDLIKIKIKAGNGGNGKISFRREKYVPNGGPNGGDGGKGGDVYLLASEEKATLLDFQYLAHFSAQDGKGGESWDKTGRSGEDLYIKVPVGTIVREVEEDFNLKQTPEFKDFPIVADLSNRGQLFLIAKGGKGGRGNAAFKSATNQAPQIAEPGVPGEERFLLLELKLVADVGIVGLPNAGKSTLISRLTASRPKIADYAFTTLEPNLGVGEVDGRSFVMADIPGLIEGASKGKGLGHEFLRHAERTKIIIHLVGLDSPTLRLQDYIDAIETINTELFQHSPQLKDKRQLLAVNKIDLPNVRDIALELEHKMKSKNINVIGISAYTGQGLEKLKREILLQLSESEKEALSTQLPEEPKIPVYGIDDLKSR